MWLSWSLWVLRWQTVLGGCESAVYRITGVLSVIGGWFITAGAAFTICFIVALLIYWGGIPALVAMIGLAIYSLVRSHFAYKAKLRKEALKEEVNSTVSKLRKATDTRGGFGPVPRA